MGVVRSKETLLHVDVVSQAVRHRNASPSMNSEDAGFSMHELFSYQSITRM